LNLSIIIFIVDRESYKRVRFDHHAPCDETEGCGFKLLLTAVFRILKTMKTRGIYMKVDDQNADPIRLKLLKGAPGLQSENQLYVTVECFVCEGLAESPGERIIKSQDPLDLGP
jgi:hypothetical protein